MISRMTQKKRRVRSNARRGRRSLSSQRLMLTFEMWPLKMKVDLHSSTESSTNRGSSTLTISSCFSSTSLKSMILSQSQSTITTFQERPSEMPSQAYTSSSTTMLTGKRLSTNHSGSASPTSLSSTRLPKNGSMRTMLMKQTKKRKKSKARSTEADSSRVRPLTLALNKQLRFFHKHFNRF